MSNEPLICANDDCHGKDFEHGSGTIRKCVYCGTTTELHPKIVKKKLRPKKVSPAKEYSPLTLIHERKKD